MKEGALPRLHLVSDDRIVAREDFARTARALRRRAESRLAFHLRAPGMSGRSLLERAGAIREGEEGGEGPLLVNDRVDLGLALSLDGVHLGGRSLPLSVARRLLGPRPWIGASVHRRREAAEADADGADYLFVGTIFRTESHPEREPAGTIRVTRTAEAASCPVLAIGGVTPSRVAPVLEAGAYGVAVRGGIWEVDRPLAALERYLRALDT